MTALLIIAAFGLIGLGIEIAVAMGIGRAIRAGNPTEEKPIQRQEAVLICLVPRKLDVRI